MNIFYLHESPLECAQYHCDKHVVKMIVEYAQLMSTAHRVLDGEMYIDRCNNRNIKRWKLNDQRENKLYKASHINHPSAIWCRESLENYNWLFDLFSELCKEYTHRYTKVHATPDKLINYLDMPPSNIQINKPFTQPPPAMKQYPQCIVPGDSISSYQNYYVQAKSGFARWTRRQTPEFMSTPG